MRYRICFSGPVAPEIVRWLQHLIPVLRNAPDDVLVDVEITHREVEDGDSDRPDAPA